MTASIVVLVVTALFAASNPAGRSAAAQPRRDYAKLNVCEAVPGEIIAHAVGGKLTTVRGTTDKSFSRCRYTVAMPGTDKPSGYLVWISPPEDFEDLKKSIEEPRTTVTGLGDGAYIYRDKGDGRFKIYVLKRGDLTLEATADSPESARKVADAVAAHLWKAPLR
jgi:hypothetical protein